VLANALVSVLPNQCRASLLAMNFFDNGSFGSWQEHFSFVEDLGCAFSFIGFVLFVVVVVILSHVFFN
jgi:hypothetical protein